MATKFKPCLIEGCNGNAHYAASGYRGWCSAHYGRWVRNGDPLGGRPTMNGDPQRFIDDIVLEFRGEACLAWPFATNSLGRAQINLAGKPVEVARLACEHRHGPPPSPEHEAAHNCGNGHEGCCNPDHLRWATTVENQRDRVKHGTSNRGERSGNSKLTEPEVREILALEGKMSRAKIGKMFGVHGNTVAEIHKRRNWSWLTDAAPT